eukprot:8482162-Heterocapsa_arctica.AAC.1
MEIRGQEWMARWSKRATREAALKHLSENPEEAHISLEQLEKGLRKFVAGTAAAASGWSPTD